MGGYTEQKVLITLGSSSSCRNNNCHENFTLPAWSVGGDWGWQSYSHEDKSLPNIFTLARNNSHYPRCVVHYLALRLDPGPRDSDTNNNNSHSASQMSPIYTLISTLHIWGLWSQNFPKLCRVCGRWEEELDKLSGWFSKQSEQKTPHEPTWSC